MSEFIKKIKAIPDLLYGKGCSREQLENAQSTLGLIFPEEFAEYVLEFGFISFDGAEWTGLGWHNNGAEIVKESNTVTRTLMEREVNPDFPSNMLVLEDLGYDAEIVAVNEAGKVFYIAYDACEEAFDSLSDYLDECLRQSLNSEEDE